MNAVVHQNSVSIGDKYVAVRYIGKKPSKKDSVLGRPNLIWHGYGAVKWVPEKDAIVYIGFADIWELATDVEVPEGGIMGLANVSHATRPPPSDPKSTNPLPAAISRKPDATYDSDPKAESPLVEAIKGFVASPEGDKLTLEAATSRITLLMQAFPKLRPSEFEPNGKPKANGFMRVIGGPVSRVERDIVWNMLSAKRAELHQQAQAEEAVRNGTAEDDEDDAESDDEAPPAADAAAPADVDVSADLAAQIP